MGNHLKSRQAVTSVSIRMSHKWCRSAGSATPKTGQGVDDRSRAALPCPKDRNAPEEG